MVAASKLIGIREYPVALLGSKSSDLKQSQYKLERNSLVNRQWRDSVEPVVQFLLQYVSTYQTATAWAYCSRFASALSRPCSSVFQSSARGVSCRQLRTWFTPPDGLTAWWIWPAKV